MSQNNKKIPSNWGRQIKPFQFLAGKFELLTLREVGRHMLPDLQWRPAGKGLWQHGGFRPYPWKQNWVSFHSCHLRLLMQPDSEKKIRTNPLIYCRQPRFDEKMNATEFWRKRKKHKYLYFSRQIVVITWWDLQFEEREKKKSRLQFWVETEVHEKLFFLNGRCGSKTVWKV